MLFHARGGDEQQMVRSMPALSWRNYVGLSLRGPEPWTRRGRPEGFGWGPAFARPDRRAPRPAPAVPEAELFRRRLQDASPDPIDALEDGIFAAIRQTRRRACTSTPSGSSWSASARGRRSPTGSA